MTGLSTMIIPAVLITSFLLYYFTEKSRQYIQRTAQNNGYSIKKIKFITHQNSNASLRMLLCRIKVGFTYLITIKLTIVLDGHPDNGHQNFHVGY